MHFFGQLFPFDPLPEKRGPDFRPFFSKIWLDRFVAARVGQKKRFYPAQKIKLVKNPVQKNKIGQKIRSKKIKPAKIK